MPTQADKANRFRALHQRDRAFLIPNPWDAGTARLLARLGFEALAHPGLDPGITGNVGVRGASITRPI